MNTVLLILGISFFVVGLILFIVFLSLDTSLFALFPLLFVIIGGVCIFIVLRKKLKEKKLRQNGRKVWAVITDLSPNFSVTINGRHPYILHCEYEGALFQADYEKAVSSNLVGKTVPVYVSLEKPSEYFVDTSAL